MGSRRSDNWKAERSVPLMASARADLYASWASWSKSSTDPEIVAMKVTTGLTTPPGESGGDSGDGEIGGGEGGGGDGAGNVVEINVARACPLHVTPSASAMLTSELRSTMGPRLLCTDSVDMCTYERMVASLPSRSSSVVA